MTILWTVQNKNVVSILQSRGRYEATFDYVDIHRREPYLWMMEQMNLRGVTIIDNPPVWAMLEKPPSRSSTIWSLITPDDRLLKLCVPAGRFLKSYHYPWSTVVLYGDHLFWDAEDRVRYPDCIVPPIEARRDSWAAIFKIDAKYPHDFTWGREVTGEPFSNEVLFRLQATLPFLFHSDLKEVIENW